MEGLDLENILDENQIETLFGEVETEDHEEEAEEPQKGKKEKEKEKENTAEVNPEDIFQEPESVGSEDDNTGRVEDTTEQSAGASPDFFSSIANAFAEEGIFPDLDDETIKNIKTPEDFRKAIDEQIKAGLDEQQKRVAEALGYGVEPNKIQAYENLLAELDKYDDSFMKTEGEENDAIRKSLIYQDYINRGFSKERAEKEVNRSYEAGNEVEDSIEALSSLKSFYSKEYQNLIKEAKAKEEEYVEEQKKNMEAVRKNIMDGDFKFLEGINVDKKTRQAAYDAITKPIFKDRKTGRTYTAVQKLEFDDRNDFAVKLGLIYALTDGFKNVEKLVSSKVKKEVKKGFQDLERVINNTSRDTNGNLRFTSGVSDSESYIGKGIQLDI